MPTIRAVGVASPSAQGQAITRTETAASSAMGKCELPPMSSQRTKVSTEMTITTGTKIELILSAIFWTGALLPCASRTIRTICARTVPLPTCEASMVRDPRWLIVPARTLSPDFFSTGRGSPLIILSSTYESPSFTTPSTGIRSPGRTTIRSPVCSCATGTSFSISGKEIFKAEAAFAAEIMEVVSDASVIAAVGWSAEVQVAVAVLEAEPAGVGAVVVVVVQEAEVAAAVGQAA